MENIRDLIPTKPGVNLLDINLTEQKLGVIFPEQYRGLIQLVNNAEIGEWTLFPIKDYKTLRKLGMTLLDKIMRLEMRECLITS